MKTTYSVVIIPESKAQLYSETLKTTKLKGVLRSTTRKSIARKARGINTYTNSHAFITFIQVEGVREKTATDKFPEYESRRLRHRSPFFNQMIRIEGHSTARVMF